MNNVAAVDKGQVNKELKVLAALSNATVLTSLGRAPSTKLVRLGPTGRAGLPQDSRPCRRGLLRCEVGHEKQEGSINDCVIGSG